MSSNTSDSHAGRTPQERVALAMPSSVVRTVLWSMIRLPPGSVLRRRFFKRALVRGFEAPSRNDYDFPLLFYEPDVEIRIFGEVPRVLGLAEHYHGHQGFVQVWRDYREEIEDLHIEPQEIVDLGDRMAVRVLVTGHGRRSGIETAESEGQVLYFSRRGLVARQDAYRDWDQALAALEQPE